MTIPLYQVDAFSSGPFTGNPAAVCVLETWLPDALMQAIAQENNLSETAFVLPQPDGTFDIRWFTPQVEVDLCGHATLAAAYVLFHHAHVAPSSLEFQSRSGLLRVHRSEDGLYLDFPSDQLMPAPEPVSRYEQVLQVPVQEAYQGRSDTLLILSNEALLRALKPNLHLMKDMPSRGFIVSAPGEEVDFVSRFFCPAVGIDEDPVTGSAHTTLTPYWANRLGKLQLQARQLSARGGWLTCKMKGDRVLIHGNCHVYMSGTVQIQ